jgi:hypothetical protein
MFNTYPQFALSSMNSTGVADGKLIRFSITNTAPSSLASSLGVAKFTFTVSTSTLSATNFALYGFTDSGFATPISDNVAVGGISSSGQIDTTLSTTSCAAIYDTAAGSTCRSTSSLTTLVLKTAVNSVQVPAGTTRYFELRASIAGIATGATVVTTLQADSSMATGTVSALSSSNFIWSPNATSTQAITGDNDWANGFLPSAGLPTAGLIQTRSI